MTRPTGLGRRQHFRASCSVCWPSQKGHCLLASQLALIKNLKRSARAEMRLRAAALEYARGQAKTESEDYHVHSPTPRPNPRSKTSAKHKTGNVTHDSACLAAESTRQVAEAAASTQTGVNNAWIATTKPYGIPRSTTAWNAHGPLRLCAISAWQKSIRSRREPILQKFHPGFGR